MGMYTELQGSIKFKSKPIAEAFCDSWESVANLIPEVVSFVTYSRSGFIPNGVKSLNGAIVKFHTELKNYDKTIEKFLEIIPFLANSWCLESKHEECSNWALHRDSEEDMNVNGDNTTDIEWSWPKKLQLISYPEFDVFDEVNLK